MTHAAHMLFSLHGELYALEARFVREVFWLPELTSLPGLPRHIVGVINHRGRIVPVMDLDRRFGRPSIRYRLEDCVIVFEWEDIVMGVIVNEVLDVRPIAWQEVSAVPHTGVEVDPRVRFITHVATVDGRIVMLLNLTSLLRDHESVVELVQSTSAGALLSGDESHGEAASYADDDQYFFPGAAEPEREILRERTASIWRPAEQEDVSGHIALAIIRLGRAYFGVELAMAQEFVGITNITPVPCCPRFVVGDMNLRGDVVTLVDIRGLLQATVAQPGVPSKAIIVQIETFSVGVVVDEIIDMILLNPNDVEDVPLTMKTVDSAFLKGITRYAGRVLQILALPTILTSKTLTVNEEI